MLVGHLGPAGTAAVDLEAAAHDDPIERAGAHRGAERVHRALLGAQRPPHARSMRAAGSYTPKCATAVGAKSSTNVHEPVAVAGVDALERRAVQPAPRRHEVEPGDGFDVGRGPRGTARPRVPR